MRLRERAECIVGIFGGSKLGFESSDDLLKWVSEELGSPDVLDEVFPLPGGKARAIAPEKIYVIAASTLSVSALTVLVTGLILGSRMVFKMPGGGLPDFEEAIIKLPPVLGKMVELLPQHSPEIMRSCDAVIVMGADKTVEEIFRQTSWRQRFIPYGHKISCGILPMEKLTEDGARRWASRAALETRAYDQRGCLSPQTYLSMNQTVAEIFSKALAGELEKSAPGIPRSWEENAGIYLARQEAAARGHHLHASEEGNRWTVILQKDGAITSGGGGCVIRVAWTEDFEKALAPWRGWISAISVAHEGDLAPWCELAVLVNASRICRMGELQNPPISWRHDGMLRLGSLVRWLTVEDEDDRLH